MGSRAVVLGGGGVAGIAWLVGFAVALRDAGVDLADAERLVGTSAGSAVATNLATGALDEAARMQVRDETAEIVAEFDMQEFLQLATTAVSESTSPLDAVRRMANIPRRDPSVSAEARRTAVAARLPVQMWPGRALSICVVAQDTGERVVLERSAGFELVDVVMASCAVPGIWPAVELGGRLFVDGGAHSITNADVAVGADTTLILVPAVLLDHQLAVLETERDRLTPGRSMVVQADESAADAFGPNPLDPSRRAGSFEAGRRQGRQLAPAVRTFWME